MLPRLFHPLHEPAGHLTPLYLLDCHHVAIMIFKTVKTSLHFSDLPFQSWRSHLVRTLGHHFLNGYPGIFLPHYGFMIQYTRDSVAQISWFLGA